MNSSPRLQEQDVPRQVQTLGSVKLRDEYTKETILVPTPSDDPNDPLNWSMPFRVYLILLTCFTLILSNFLAAGPSVTIVEVTIDLLHAFPPTPKIPASFAPASIQAFTSAVAKMSYIFSVFALMQGLSNLIWMPLIVKYGRRPVYIVAWLGYTVFAIVASRAENYATLLGSRIVVAFFAGSAESMAPLTIADLTFLHQRGAMMALYTVALTVGGSVGQVIDGGLSTATNWRAIYYLGAGLGGLAFILILFTFPETAYNRVNPGLRAASGHPLRVNEKLGHASQTELLPASRTAKKPLVQRLKIFNGTLTHESLLTIFLRPISMFALPPVFWATIMLGLHIGFYVVIGNTAATSFTELYRFSTLQVGLLWLSVIIGGLVGLPFAGWLTDVVADYLTRRNRGIREPEMRLPSMIFGMILAPGGILIYGLTLAYQRHWIGAAIGLAIFSFAVSVNTNITMVYAIDAYRPVAGEVVVTQQGLKAVFAFLLAFYANNWLANVGYAGTFGAQAGILFGVAACWIPLYIWGRKIRHATFNWKIMSSVRWDLDRETGE